MQTIVSQLPNHRDYVKGKDTLKIGYPWLSYGALITIEAIVSKSMRVLEFGSGGSTIFWAKNCKSVKSYETNPEWYKAVKHKIDKLKLKNVELMFWNNRIRSVDIIRSEHDDNYDMVLIDSDPKHSRRLDLANNAAPKIKKGGWLIIDNYLKFGLDRFDYSKWEVYTFDQLLYTGHGTRLCRNISTNPNLIQNQNFTDNPRIINIGQQNSVNWPLSTGPTSVPADIEPGVF